MIAANAAVETTDAGARAEAIPRSTMRRAVIASTIGNAFEWFDFAIYGFFASVIAQVFFPSGNPALAFLLTMATFAIGFVVRPFGGILLAMYADRAGRQRALSLLILMMAGGSLMIGIMPSYDSIGLAAPLLVIVARIVQGLSVGGEFASATSMLFEYAPKHRRMFYGSFQMCSQALATLLATLSGFALGSFLMREDLVAWGWRIPFLFGVLIGPVGFYIRRRVAESPEFVALKRAQAAKARVPFFTELRQSPLPLLCAFFLVMPATAAVFLLFVYIPGVMVSKGQLALAPVMLSAAIGNAILVVLYLAAGRLADKVGWSQVSIPAMLVLAVIVYPLLDRFYAAPSFATLAQMQIAASLVIGFLAGPVAGALAAMFPTTIRATGIAIAQNLAVTLFGGLSPLIVGALVGATGNPMSTAWFLIALEIAGAVLVTLCLSRMKR